MSEIRVNSIVSETGTGNVAFNKGINVTGVVTGTSFAGDGSGLTNLVGTGVTNNVNTVNLNVISGVSTFGAAVTVNDGTDSTSTTTGALIVTGGVGIGLSLTVGGSVSVGGTLTYEDVTNVDSVGMVTARGGLEIGAAGVGGTITAVGNAILSGITTVGTGLSFADNVKACFGNAGDLQIYHDGSHSFIKDAGTGNLRLGANDLRIQTDDFAENYILGTKNGAVSVYYDNGVKLQTTNTGVEVTGVTSTTSLSVGPGVLQEKLYNVASALTGTVNFDVVDNGLVQYYTTNSSGTFVVNLRGDGSTTFNSLMDIGKTTVFTLYSAQNNASYYMTDFQIDGSSITEKWNGGSAPSAGTASGTDVYTFNIMKTADATFTVFATFSNFA